MRPEDKVVSLETAKKLREAGFPQDTESTEWAWIKWKLKFWQLENRRAADYPDYSEHGEGGVLAAPDATEILEHLPIGIVYTGERMNIYLNADDYSGDRKFECGYSMYGDCMDFIGGREKTESEARATCYLELKENGLI